MDFFPKWVESGNPTERGLDLTGLRNPVQKIVDTFLNGVTTITPMLRYISIRALAAHLYVNSGNSGSSTEFRKFAEKLEAAVAYGNLIVNPSEVGLLGALKASERIAGDDSQLPLDDLVKQLGVSIYAGPSDQLEISFRTESGIPGFSAELGLPLATRMAQICRTTSVGRKFMNGNPPESCSREELEEFGGAFGIRTFDAEERELLIKAILPDVVGRTQVRRVATYGLLLRLASLLNRRPTEKDVVDAAIRGRDANIPDVFNQALDGWLAFAVRELFATAHEYVLQEVTRDLSRKKSQLLPQSEVISNVITSGGEEEFLSPLRKLRLLGDDERAEDVSFSELQNRLVDATNSDCFERSGLLRWSGDLNELSLLSLLESKTLGSGCVAVLPLVWLLAARRIADAESGGTAVRLLSFGGKERLSLTSVVTQMIASFISEGLNLAEVSARLAHLTVRQHLRIAWQRFGDDPTKMVAVITSDGDNWAFRHEFAAGRSASRIPQAIGWLEQLGLVGADGITEDGENRLRHVVAALAAGGEAA